MRAEPAQAGYARKLAPLLRGVRRQHMNSDVVRIAEFRSNHQADIAKIVLNGSGILAEVLTVPTEGDRGAFVIVRKEDEAAAGDTLQAAGMIQRNETSAESGPRGLTQ